MEQDRS